MNMIYQCVKSLRETDSFPLTQKKRKLATMAGSKQIKGLSISSEGWELPHSSGRIWCWPHTDAVEQAPLKSDLLPPTKMVLPCQKQTKIIQICRYKSRKWRCQWRQQQNQQTSWMSMTIGEKIQTASVPQTSPVATSVAMRAEDLRWEWPVEVLASRNCQPHRVPWDIASFLPKHWGHLWRKKRLINQQNRSFKDKNADSSSTTPGILHYILAILG